MIGSPTPGLRAHPGPTESRIPEPLPPRERRPRSTDAERPPTKSITAARRPGAVGVEIGETGGVVRRTCVLKRGAGRRGYCVNLAGNPAVEIIFLRDTANVCGGIVPGFHRKRLALFEPRGLILVPDGIMAFDGFHRAAVIVIVQPETAPAVGFHG